MTIRQSRSPDVEVEDPDAVIAARLAHNKAASFNGVWRRGAPDGQ